MGIGLSSEPFAPSTMASASGSHSGDQPPEPRPVAVPVARLPQSLLDAMRHDPPLPALGVVQNADPTFGEVCIKERLSKKSNQQDWLTNGCRVTLLEVDRSGEEKFLVRYRHSETGLLTEGYVLGKHVIWPIETELVAPEPVAPELVAPEPAPEAVAEPVAAETLPEEEHKTKRRCIGKAGSGEQSESSASAPSREKLPLGANPYSPSAHASSAPSAHALSAHPPGCPECVFFASGECLGHPGYPLVLVTHIPGTNQNATSGILCSLCCSDKSFQHPNLSFTPISRRDLGP